MERCKGVNMFCKILLVCWCVVCAWSGADASSSTHPLLLIVSFDGFRYDYLDKTNTPNFDALIADGVKAKWMEASFPTKTFPNHYTLATGLYEESHGIIANNFYDPDLDATFHKRTSMTESRWWDAGAEPIWVTNQRCDRAKEAEPGCRSRRSGAFFWVGSEAEVKGQQPHRYMAYDESYPFRDRVETVVSWLTDADAPTNLGLMYFHEPDSTGHTHGPDSPELATAVKMVDDVVGHLVKRLRDVGLYDRVNLIVTSDHGMTSVHPKNTIMLDDYIDSATYRGQSIPGSVALIYPMAGNLEKVVNVKS
ncbi:PREDICTED: ectonucleotide pyrophosphatase/phosphodiesterase family member 5-like [Priapulus caudatus]|uniref:Ectonucleotide pyrophosphatase/phosphodiesterase family member 5-like n=1 Tax=Priapulus caudatus TaxID=37621 RepID=A0ABM1EU97_PRICU|nr:PREDICTED: ectonucleotide pyrophosphatase/phosphodiesterase family member 5-like [Priapulus caudatus]